MLSLVLPIFAVLTLIFSVFTLYNVPIVVAGFGRLWRRRKKELVKSEIAEQELPVVSIVLPVKNEAKVVSRLLNALSRLDYPSDKMEVIVVNDASSDLTGEICHNFCVAHPGFRVVERAASTTKAAALNFGVRYALGEIVATFDGDSVPESDAVLKAVSYFADPSVGAVQGRISSVNAEQNMLTRFISYESLVQFEVYVGGKDALDLFVSLAGTCQFVRKADLEAVGGWNEDSLAEDTELSARLIEKGRTIRYAPEARTFEESPSSIKGLLTQRARWFRGTIEVGFKFGRLMRRPDLRRVDAEMTFLAPFVIMLCLVNYFAPIWAFSVPPNSVWLMVAQVIGCSTLLILGVVGLALASASKSLRWRNVLWLPFVYAYWVFQSLVALYAFFEILFRRKRRWRKTEHSGLVTKQPKNDLHRDL